MKLIERDYYLNKLQDVRDIPDIKVITGVRRCGKSKLMDAFINLVEKEKDVNIFTWLLLLFIPINILK